MTDDGKRKPDPKRSMDDRTIPVPVADAALSSADTQEADEQTFIGLDRLKAPGVATPPAAVPQPSAPSFDDELERKRGPAPRRATRVKALPLDERAADHPTEKEPPPATAVPGARPGGPDAAPNDGSESSPSEVFTSVASHQRKRALQQQETQLLPGRAASRATRAEGDGARGASAPPSSAALRAPPVAGTQEADPGPTRQFVEVAAKTAEVVEPGPISAPPVEDDVVALAQDAGALASTPSFPRPRFPTGDVDRIANEDTRVKSLPEDPAPSAPLPGSRGPKLVVLIFLVGTAALATIAVGRWRVAAVPAPLAQVVIAREPPAATTPAAAPSLTTPPSVAPTPPPTPTPPTTTTMSITSSAPAVVPTAEEATAAAPAPADPVAAASPPTPPRPGPATGGFTDRSGAGVLGLAPALSSKLRPLVRAASASGKSLRGEVRSATLKDGVAVVECSFTVVSGRVRRATLQATARADDAGQGSDRLMRLAAQRCGQALAPDLETALGVVAKR